MNNGSQWPATSSDTGNVLRGMPLDDLLIDNGATAGFSIDYERVPQAITDLRQAAQFFENRVKVAEQLARIPTPGADGVSIHAVEQLGKWASDTGRDNLGAILQAGALQLRDLAHKLEEDLRNYLKVEELNLPKDPTGGLPL